MSAHARLTTEELYVRREDDDHWGDLVGVQNLLIEDITFGQLYLTSKNYTVAWPGSKDEFQFANGHARHFIYQQLESDKKVDKRNPTGFETKVTLVISGKIQEYHFEALDKDYNQLENLLSQSSFARYDFTCHFDDGSTAKYAFSAENAQVKSIDYGEMAVRLPRTSYLTKWAFDPWMIDKHVTYKKLNLKLHSDEIRHKIYDALMRMALTRPIGKIG